MPWFDELKRCVLEENTACQPVHKPIQGQSVTGGERMPDTVRARTAKRASVDEHLRTDHLNDDLAGRSVRGGAITFGAQGARFALQLGCTAILARLLTPADFGLIAMAQVVIGFVELLKDGGLSMATVQRAEVTHAQISTLFWINVGVAIILACVTMVSAPAVAWCYGEPELVGVTAALSCCLVFGGLGTQHHALLRRQMRMTALALMQVGAMASAVVTAVALGFAGAGYWALVALAGMQPLTQSILAWTLCGWRPGLPRRASGVGAMVAFGGNLTGFNFVNYLRQNAPSILIGGVWGGAALGIYSKATNLLMMPIRQINTPLASVVTPALSRLQNNPDMFRRYYCGAVRMVTYIALPLVALLAVIAEEVVLILLGPQWHEAATIFRIFGIVGLVHVIANTTGWVLTSLGQAHRMLRWSIVQSACAIVCYGAGLPWGAFGVAVGAAIGAVMLLLPNLLYAYHQSPIRLRDVLMAIRRPALLAAVVFVSGGAARWWVGAWSAPASLGVILLTISMAVIALVLIRPAFWVDLQTTLNMIRGQNHQNPLEQTPQAKPAP
jgi:PST family polysaccharide transporter